MRRPRRLYIFLGYATDVKGYCYRSLDDSKFILSKDVTFNKDTLLALVQNLPYASAEKGNIRLFPKDSYGESYKLYCICVIWKTDVCSKLTHKHAIDAKSSSFCVCSWLTDA